MTTKVWQDEHALIADNICSFRALAGTKISPEEHKKLKELTYITRRMRLDQKYIPWTPIELKYPVKIVKICAFEGCSEPTHKSGRSYRKYCQAHLKLRDLNRDLNQENRKAKYCYLSEEELEKVFNYVRIKHLRTKKKVGAVPICQYLHISNDRAHSALQQLEDRGYIERDDNPHYKGKFVLLKDKFERKQDKA